MKRSKLAARITPMQYTPKFATGQRVRISAEGAGRIAPAGTRGTVEWCGLAVLVLIDGAGHTHFYAPSFWDDSP